MTPVLNPQPRLSITARRSNHGASRGGHADAVIHHDPGGGLEAMDRPSAGPWTGYPPNPQPGLGGYPESY